MNNKNKIVIFLCICVTLLIVAITFLQSQSFTLEFDDVCEIFFAENYGKITGCFLYHGRFFINLLTKIIAFVIPTFFNIHPITWLQTGGAIIKGIFISTLLFLLTDFLFLFKKKDYLYPIICAFLFFIYTYIFIHKYQNEMYTAFYGFTFPLIFLFLFVKLFIKKAISSETIIKKKDIVIISLVSFISGSATEFTAIINTLFLFFFLLFYLIKNIKGNKKEQNIIMLAVYSFISSILGNFLLFYNFGFIQTAQDKGAFGGNIKTTILGIYSIFPEFFQSFKTVFFGSYIYFIFIIFILVIPLIFSKRNEKNKVLIISSSLLLACFTFLFLLIFAGRQFDGYIYIIHYDIIVQVWFLFAINIFILFSVLLRNNDTLFNKIVYIFILLLFFMFLQSINLNKINKK